MFKIKSLKQGDIVWSVAMGKYYKYNCNKGNYYNFSTLMGDFFRCKRATNVFNKELNTYKFRKVEQKERDEYCKNNLIKMLEGHLSYLNASYNVLA